MTAHDDDAPVLVSACLAGFSCRYDGAATPHPAVLSLVERGLAVPVCPEQLGGLPTPRDPVELVGGRAVSRKGVDVTAQFEAGARKALAIGRERGCARAVLKSRSPSCGRGKVHDGTFSGRLVPGDGLFAALLAAQGVAVVTDEEL
jgi:uncharacterized protein YbbK (DUF523 family)